MRFYTVAGIAQYISGFIAHNEKNKNFTIYGVDVLRPDEPHTDPHGKKQFKNFHLLRYVVDYPPLGTVNQLSQGSFTVLKSSFKEIIAAYAKAIQRVKPDIILINGSYFLPWCFLRAAKAYSKASLCMHYHGILKKEVAHWPNTTDRALMLKMERDFDRKNIFYIFPSKLARRTVEREVFGHSITHCAVLPNPVAPEFFATKPRQKGNGIGIVSRWSKIKNIDFIIRLARRNVCTKKPVSINIISDFKPKKNTRLFYELIQFNKPMANKNLAQFYAKQGVVISPSIFETYGNVAQEAIACGTPALVSSKMGVAETFHKLGLSNLVIDFTSSEKVLKKAKVIATTHISPEIVTMLREEYSNDKIFGQYAELLTLAP